MHRRDPALQRQLLAWLLGPLLVLLALWLLILAARTGGGVDMGDAGAVRTGLGIGAILNLLAAGAVAAGAVMKAREEKLI